MEALSRLALAFFCFLRVLGGRPLLIDVPPERIPFKPRLRGEAVAPSPVLRTLAPTPAPAAAPEAAPAAAPEPSAPTGKDAKEGKGKHGKGKGGKEAPPAKVAEVVAAPAPSAAPSAAPTAGPAEGAAKLLELFQRDGRLVDFLQEEIEGFTDEQVGAAVRAVHKGCRKVLQEHIRMEPILKGEEADACTVEPGFDPLEVRLTGDVKGNPPFHGLLVHKGWRATKIDLPEVARGHRVLGAAEVEV